MSVVMVWAQAHDGVIGDGRDMPWHVPEDLAFFREATMGQPVIMGRTTWESIPERFRPLPGRVNIVCSRDPGWTADGAHRAGSIGEALALAEESGAGPVTVIGGGEIFRAALPYAAECLVTEIDSPAPGAVCAPPLGPDWERVGVEGWISDPRSRVEGVDGEVRHRHTVWRRRTSPSQPTRSR